jgi:hypothetical protein
MKGNPIVWIIALLLILWYLLRKKAVAMVDGKQVPLPSMPEQAPLPTMPGGGSFGGGGSSDSWLATRVASDSPNDIFSTAETEEVDTPLINVYPKVFDTPTDITAFEKKKLSSKWSPNFNLDI